MQKADIHFIQFSLLPLSLTGLVAGHFKRLSRLINYVTNSPQNLAGTIVFIILAIRPEFIVIE